MDSEAQVYRNKPLSMDILESRVEAGIESDMEFLETDSQISK